MVSKQAYFHRQCCGKKAAWNNVCAHQKSLTASPSLSDILNLRRHPKMMDAHTQHIYMHNDETKNFTHRARDNPQKTMGIEIYHAADFCRMRRHWNGCGLLLHEFTHIIHQVVLGLQNQRIVDLYQWARRSGRYERTLRRDWAGKEVDHDMHYCMVDHKEFFAEMSVTYWSKGYRHLDRADASRMESCSPPLMEPNVRQRFHACQESRLLDPVTDEEGHCNKFQPFTSG